MENKNHEVLLGLTTTPKSDWKGKVGEMKQLGIKRVALFPTFLGIEKRKELYDLLDDIDGLEIPHVHLRNQDMEEWEMTMFEEKYKTQFYNIHVNCQVNGYLEKYKSKIYVENHFKKFDENHLKNFAGICLDVQHMERSKLEAPLASRQMSDLLEKYEVGCCHISSLPKIKNTLQRLLKGVAGHYMISLDEVDYVRKYKAFLPQLVSIELENSFERQMEVKKYLEENILNN